MQIPRMIYQSDAILIQPKDDDDLMMGMRDPEFPRNLEKMKNPGAQHVSAQKSIGIYYIKNFNETPGCRSVCCYPGYVAAKSWPLNENDFDQIY